MLIKLENITKTYSLNGEQTKVEALEGINLIIEKRDFIALMGQSGSGKTTLMNIIGCLDKPTSGHYFFEGQEISILSEDEISGTRCTKIGFIFQAFHLIPRLTALENVKLPLVYASVHTGMSQQNLSDTEVECKAVEALRLLGLEARAHHMPSQLSGGEKQRVAIARALVNKPSLILADEPTGNLDTVTSRGIMGIFRSINKQGTTVILVTHEEEIARYAQKIIKIKDGGLEDAICLSGKKI